MKFLKYVIALLILSSSANAALVSRLGGLAYYDTEADLTWLADANAGAGSIYDDGVNFVNGQMTWGNANAWAANLDVAGVTDWRLPDTLQPDASCDFQDAGSYGYNCNGSEMGNLFYNVLGGSAQVDLTTNHNTNYNLFTNIQYYYWSATGISNDSDTAWFFDLLAGSFVGSQYASQKGNPLGAWAVHDGDVSAVPVPAAIWLFSSGLIGLVGFAKRKKS